MGEAHRLEVEEGGAQPWRCPGCGRPFGEVDGQGRLVVDGMAFVGARFVCLHCGYVKVWTKAAFPLLRCLPRAWDG